MTSPLARLWSAVFWAAVAIQIVGVLAIRWQLASPLQGFLAMTVATLVMVLFALVSLGGLVVELARGRGFMPRRVLYLVVGLLPLAVVLATVGVSGFQAPPIHDITTDIDDPPVFHFAAMDRPPGVNPVAYNAEQSAAHQRAAYGHIQPLLLPVDPQRALALAVEVMEDAGWRILGVDEATNSAEGVDRSAIFGFEDDVVVRVRPDGEGSRVDARSASRVGLGDLGANAARVERFLAALDKKAGN